MLNSIFILFITYIDLVTIPLTISYFNDKSWHYYIINITLTYIMFPMKEQIIQISTSCLGSASEVFEDVFEGWSNEQSSKVESEKVSER